jgi:hypothetical protein
MYGEFTEAELNRDYARLVQLGITNSDRIFRGSNAAELARWQREVAECWWALMRERAEGDGLRITCYLGCDILLFSVGFENHIPIAGLVRPDGSGGRDCYFDGWLPDRKAEKAMLADWGAPLAKAQRRHPYPYDESGVALTRLEATLRGLAARARRRLWAAEQLLKELVSCRLFSRATREK